MVPVLVRLLLSSISTVFFQLVLSVQAGSAFIVRLGSPVRRSRNPANIRGYCDRQLNPLDLGQPNGSRRRTHLVLAPSFGKSFRGGTQGVCKPFPERKVGSPSDFAH